MNDSIKRISLDLHATCSREKVKVKRSDTGRKIYVSLVDGGMPYHISDDCYAIFTGKKPDGNILFNDCTIEGNVIIYKLTEQTAAVPGLVNCEIKLYGADARLITSPKFSIMVDDTVYDEGDEIESTDEFSALTALVAEVQEMKAEKGNYYAPAVSQADENTMVVSFTPSSKALPEIEDMAITLPEGPHGEPGEDGTTIHWVAASCAGSQKTIAISAFFATPKDGDYAFTNDYWLCTVSNVTATTAKIIPVGNIIGPQGDPGPAGEDGQMFHLINESGKTVDNPVTMLGSYMTEPKVDDFVLTNIFNLYVVTGVDLENQLVEVNLLGNLKGADAPGTMTVTITDDVASHTSAEIYAHVQSGGTAVLDDRDYNGLGTYPYFGGNEGLASFGYWTDEERFTMYRIYDDGSFDYCEPTWSQGDFVNSPTAAKVGQTIVVKSVDSNGKPAAWECVDLPSGGGADLIIFYIDNVAFLMEVGMTWAEWCDSRYNTGQPHGVYTYDDDYVYNETEDFVFDRPDGVPTTALPTDTIDPSRIYWT